MTDEQLELMPQEDGRVLGQHVPGGEAFVIKSGARRRVGGRGVLWTGSQPASCCRSARLTLLLAACLLPGGRMNTHSGRLKLIRDADGNLGRSPRGAEEGGFLAVFRGSKNRLLEIATLRMIQAYDGSMDETVWESTLLRHKGKYTLVRVTPHSCSAEEV
jgi:hypothetical protein